MNHFTRVRNFSFGYITSTRLWVSFVWNPVRRQRWWFAIGSKHPTYNGTTHGLHVGTPLFTILGHKRDLS